MSKVNIKVDPVGNARVFVNGQDLLEQLSEISQVDVRIKPGKPPVVKFTIKGAEIELEGDLLT